MGIISNLKMKIIFSLFVALMLVLNVNAAFNRASAKEAAKADKKINEKTLPNNFITVYMSNKEQAVEEQVNYIVEKTHAADQNIKEVKADSEVVAIQNAKKIVHGKHTTKK